MEYIAHGIILQAKDLKNEDKIYRIFTFEKGLITAIGKSVSSTKSKLSGFLMVGNHCVFMLASGKNYDKIAQVKVIKSYNFINSYDLFILSSQAIELLLDFLEHSGKETNMYNNTIDFFDDLSVDGFNISNKKLFQILYFADLIKEFGFTPNWFNLSVKLNSFLEDIFKNNYFKNKESVIKLDISEADLFMLKNWFKNYLESVIEKKLKSFS